MTDANIDTLARTIYGEARGEPYLGKVAVANVVMNRVALFDQHDHFGLGSVASACIAPWQFSAWNANDPNLPIIQAVTADDPVFADCLDIATTAVAGQLDDVTGGATFYFRIGSPEPNWAVGQTPCYTIGNHLFFKNIA